MAYSYRFYFALHAGIALAATAAVQAFDRLFTVITELISDVVAWAVTRFDAAPIPALAIVATETFSLQRSRVDAYQKRRAARLRFDRWTGMPSTSISAAPA